MQPEEFQKPRGWVNKFRNAFRGCRRGIRGEISFFVHFLVTSAVVLAGVCLQISHLEWCLLLLCVSTVLTAEMFNSSLERLAKAVDRQFNPLVGESLDIASGAVLIAALGAVAVGLAIFVRPLFEVLMHT